MCNAIILNQKIESNVFFFTYVAFCVRRVRNFGADGTFISDKSLSFTVIHFCLEILVSHAI
jgi:hypothetical protein